MRPVFIGSFKEEIDFPAAITRHRLEYPDTDLWEQSGKALVESEFQESDLARFIRQVCRWGGYYGIAGRVRKYNQPHIIGTAFRAASGSLANNDPGAALRNINAIKGLGRPSFASKMLRFLDPQQCAVLDSVIAKHTGHAETVDGYVLFLRDCANAAQSLNANEANNPARGDGKWLVADIEGALFAHIQGL